MTSIINIFDTYSYQAADAIKPKQKRGKLAVKEKVLDPALLIFTKDAPHSSLTLSSTNQSADEMQRLSDLEKQELINKYSVLNQTVAHNTLAQSGEHMTALLGQMHADALIADTPLQQLPPAESVRAWRGLLSQVTEVDIPSQVLEGLKQIENTSERTCKAMDDNNSVFKLARENAHAVFDLKEGQSYFIEGGTKKEGVDLPILFEFIRTGENSFDLYVYLVGKGHIREEIVEKGKKRWIKPLIYYTDIPADTHLFFSGKREEIQIDFFQTLLEQRCLSYLSESKHIGLDQLKSLKKKHVSLDQLGHLQTFRQELPSSSISGRKADSDAWAVIKPFVIRHLGKERYKKAILEMKLNALVQGFQAAKWIAEDSSDGEKLRIVLKRGAQLILKQLASLHVASIQNSQLVIGENLFLKARATSLDLIECIEQMEKRIAEERLSKSHSLTIEPLDKTKNETRKRYKKALKGAKRGVCHPKKNQASIRSTRARLISLPASENFVAEMGRFTAAYKDTVLVPGIRTAEIEHLVQQMSIPHGEGIFFWESIPQKEVLDAMEALGILVSIYTQSISERGEQITARESNTAHSLYAIIHYLALRHDKTLFPEGANSAAALSNFPVYFGGMYADQDNYLMFTSLEDYKRREALIDYFKNSYSEASKDTSLFNWRSLSAAGGSVTYLQHNFFQENGIGTYLFALAHDTRFGDLLSRENLSNERAFKNTFLMFVPDKFKKGWLVSELANKLFSDPKNSMGQLHDPQLFASRGFAHLPILVKAAYSAFLFENQQSDLLLGSHEPSFRSFFVANKNDFGEFTNFYCAMQSAAHYSPPNSSELHPALRHDQRKLLQESIIQRDKSENTSKVEGMVLRDAKRSDGSCTEEIALLRASCEPSLFPQKLIAYFRAKLHLLESFEEQELFEIALWRSVALKPMDQGTYSVELGYYGRTRFFPLAEQIQQKGFQDQLKLFIQEGLDHFFLRQPDKRPNVLAATCFIRFACRLSRFLEGAPLVDTLDYLHKMLETEDLKPEERSLLSIHLVLAYSTLKHDLTSKEAEEIFGAWVYYKNTPLPETLNNPLLEKEVTTFIHAASAYLENFKDESFHQQILKTALKQLGIELPHKYSISILQPHLIYSGGIEEFWEINLLTGEVGCEGGILRRTQAPKDLQNEIFTYLFGNIKLSYFESEGCFYFSHPELGSCRALCKDFSPPIWPQLGKEKMEFTIQRQFNGDWYQYVHPAKLQNLPQIFCASYTHWISCDFSTLKICERKSGRTIAEVGKAGELTEIENKGSIWSFSESNFFMQFERETYIHRLEADGKRYIILPRYVSQSHQMLLFEEEGTDFVFSENRKYRLANKQTPGLLGAKNGSLVLEHRETDAQKVIVPLRPLKEHTNLSSKHEIDVENGNVSSEKEKHTKISSEREIDEQKKLEILEKKMGELFTVQKKRFEFLEFDVKDGALQPLTQEGTAYLAYQFLAQRRYAEAFQWLKTLNFRERLSSKTQKFLSLLIEIASSTDHAPEAAAIALHAWIVLAKASKRAKIEMRAFDKPPSASIIKETYARYEHQIPEHYLLNQEEKSYCNLAEKGKWQRLYYPNIMKYSPLLDRQQHEIKPMQLPSAFTGLTIKASEERDRRHTECVEENKRFVLEQTEFIPIRPVENTYTKPYTHASLWTSQFEKGFFPQAYQIAQSGSDLARKQLKFRLDQTALYYQEHFQEYPKSWRYLLLALKYPEEVPNLPDHQNFEARMQFVNVCATVWENHYQELGYDADTAVSGPIKETLARPISAQVFPPKKVHSPPRTPLGLFPFSKEAIDNGFTSKLFTNKKYFIETQKQIPQGGNVPDQVEEDSVAAEEKEFLDVLQAEFKEFSEDYKEGAKINKERKFYALKDHKKLKGKLEGEIQNLENELADLEVSILELANKHDPDDRKKTLYKEGKIEQELSLKQLADLFLQGDADRFAKANPYLRDPRLIAQLAQAYGLREDQNLVIDYLYNTIALYMTIHVNKTRLKRAVKLCKEIDPLDENDLKRDALVQKLADELKPSDKPVYSIKDYPAFLVFEYLSELSIRSNQATLLEKLLQKDAFENYIPRVIQLIMGGGKTSVMAVILLKLAARKGRLSLFVTPASQYASVSYNLRKTLRECFGIDMEEIEVTRELLAKSEEMCVEIRDRLNAAVYAGNFLLIKSEILQTIGLEFLDLVYQAATAEEESLSPMGKINILREVLLIFRKKGDALFDEVDLLLSVLQEVNFPVGKEEIVSAQRIEVIRSLFTLLTSKNIALSDQEMINLDSLIALKANRQNLVSQETWKSTIARAVAWNLPRTLESLKLSYHLHFCESLYRYINGTMSVRCQIMLDHPEQVFDLTTTEKIDFEFLSYLRRLNQSKDPEEQEASHQIALIKHMMQTVLPVTFSKNGKRHYGRGGERPGEVRPYLAVDTPSDNLFGYHWEAVAYHFQTALQCGISKEQMLHISRIYKEQAEIHADRERIVFDATLEAIEFKRLTKVALHDLDKPGKIEEATQNLNENVEALLQFEADTANEFVTYYPFRLTSTGQTLVNMLSTVRAMSGTPYNTICYPKKLAKNFDPALGTEGQIAGAVLGRIATKKPEKKYAHILKSDDVATILKDLLENHPEKERVQILMDSGALFKDLTNIEIAQHIRDITQKPVLFFMRNPRIEEKTPDTLAVLKVGSTEPTIIGGTKLDDIQKKGLEIKDYIVYADERHTTGTDIPLIPDAIGLMTLDEMMLRRTFFQAVLRERDFFLNQDVEFVIPHYLCPLLEKQSAKKDDPLTDYELIFSHLLLSIKNQAIAKSKHFYRSCKQKIDELFKASAFEELLPERELTVQDIKNIFPPYLSNILSKQGDDLYNKFGALEDAIDSMEALKAYVNRKLNQFPDDHPQRKKIERETQKILKEAKRSPYRPKKVWEAASQDLGIQVDVLTEVNEQVDLHVEQEVEQELLQELAFYQNVPHAQLRDEDEWSDEKIISFLRALQEGTDPQIALPTLSEVVGSQTVGYRKSRDFTPVFSNAIQVTPSWALTAKNPLPVFHKMQRPLDQLLIVKTGGKYQVIGLSQKEAREFKRCLASAPKSDLMENVWLIQPDGSPLQDTPAGPLPIDDVEIRRILIECNAFNGRIDFLDTHPELATQWLEANERRDVKVKKDFLALRVAQNPLQKKLFFKSEVFGDVKSQEAKRQFRWNLMAKQMSEYDEAKIQALTNKDVALFKLLKPAQLNLVKPEQVKLLDGQQIPYLTKEELIQQIPQKFASVMRPNQMDKLAKTQVAWFEESVVLTQAMPASFCQHMSDAQIKLLSPQQVRDIRDKNQINRLEPALLAHISEEQVRKQLISEEQVQHLRSREAVHALPEAWQRSAPAIFRPEPVIGVNNPALDRGGRTKASMLSITRVVLIVLGLLIGCGLIVAGAFAIMGGYWQHAPQFMVKVYHALQSSLVMPIGFVAGGTFLAVSLIAYSIYLSRKGKALKRKELATNEPILL